jgi:hypothetical protein
MMAIRIFYSRCQQNGFRMINIRNYPSFAECPDGTVCEIDLRSVFIIFQEIFRYEIVRVILISISCLDNGLIDSGQKESHF